MPHTYPSPQQCKSASTYANPHVPRRPSLTAPNSTRYLSPIQEQRILSWRSNTSSTPPISPVSGTNKIKSAPASLNLPVPSASSTTTSPCLACAAKSLCSCSTKSPRSTRQKGYYSNKKKSFTNLTSFTPMTPMTSAMLPDRRGMPSAAQMEAHGVGSPPPTQFGQVPTVPLPEPALAAPPVKPDPPRIAGGRDPITQD